MVKRNPPLVDQVKIELLSEIHRGTIVRSDGRLPPEVELAKRYGVSRATLREALSQMDLAGVIVRRHGVGTYVRGSFLERDGGEILGWFDISTGFLDLIKASGREAGFLLVESHSQRAGPLAHWLELDQDDPVFSFTRVFTSNGVPIILSETAIPVAFVGTQALRVLERESTGLASVYSLLENYAGRTVHDQNIEITATVADEELAGYLDLDVGRPLLKLIEIGSGKGGRPLFFAVNYFRPDKVTFRQTRKPGVMTLTR
jgi:GntR family transcriptional regulator